MSARAFSGDEITAGLLCGFASLATAGIYLFGFGNQPFSTKSFFWLMPLLSPFAVVVYRKSKAIGASLLAVLYIAAVFGAYSGFKQDCSQGVDCYTNSKLMLFLSGTIAGYHIIAMLAALIVMCVGLKKSANRNVVDVTSE